MPLLFTEEDLDVMISLRNAFNGDEILNPREDAAYAAHVPRDHRAHRRMPCWRRRGCEHRRHDRALRPRAARHLRRGACHRRSRLSCRQAPILGVAPAVAVYAGSADEVAAILRFANEHGLSVVPAGGLHPAADRQRSSRDRCAAVHLTSHRGGALRSRRSDHWHRRGLHGCATVVPRSERTDCSSPAMLPFRNAPPLADCWPPE